MELRQLRVRNYKCIEDSEWIDLEQVTCFVGKNESGKTAFLEAIHKLNPVASEGKYNHIREYPRSTLPEYKRRHEKDPAPVASAKFNIEAQETVSVEDEYGDGILDSSEVILTKDYQNQYSWEIDVDEEQAVAYFVDQFDLPDQTEKKFATAESLSQLREYIDESESDSEGIPQLEARIEDLDADGLQNIIGSTHFDRFLPSFLYFDDYSILESEININSLRSRKSNNNLSDSDRTFLSLLSIAVLNIEDINSINEYEESKADLEGAANYITDRVFDYWSQSDDLRVEFDKKKEPTNPNNNNFNTVLKIRIYNERDRMTLPFNERSKGFIWFFSFLAYFSDMSEDGENLVLLLDEPGLNLHAKAQRDFLRFINERLAPDYPVAYTTHSPFMLEPKHIDRARLVAYEEGEGTKLSEDILGTDDDTIFPLQATLGYDLIQTLLIGPQVLLVEGKSDMIYLQLMSAILEDQDRTALSHQWTVVPVDGADNVPTFISMFGPNNLDIGVFIDSDERIGQRLEDIEDRQLIDLEDVKMVTGYVDEDSADTEDMFSKEFYLDLVNGAYLAQLRMVEDVPDELSLDDFQNQNPRITKRLESYFEEYQINSGDFYHNDPAKHFQKNRAKFEQELDTSTLERFENLFEDLNQIIKS